MWARLTLHKGGVEWLDAKLKPKKGELPLSGADFSSGHNSGYARVNLRRGFEIVKNQSDKKKGEENISLQLGLHVCSMI